MDLLERMRTFVRIADAGSLSAAARGRRLSLAAVSRQLAALEDELGVELVARSTRRLRITPAGQRWYEHCVRLLRDLDDARAEVAAPGRIDGTVAISAGISIGLRHVVPRLARLARSHPRLTIDLRLEDHVVDLIGDGIDVAVRAGLALPDSASVVARPVLEFVRRLAAAPAYLRRRGVPQHPRELARHDGLVQVGAGRDRSSWTLVRGDERCEVTPHPRMRSTAPVVLAAWAIDGAGVAFLPDWLIAAHPRALRPILDGWAGDPVRAWAIHRVELRGAARIRAVLDALA